MSEISSSRVPRLRGFWRDPEKRAVVAPPIVALISLGLMLLFSVTLGLPIRDPDAKYVGSPLALIGLMALIFISIDVLPRAFSRARSERAKPWPSIVGVLRERWGNRRGLVVVLALVSFYVTYISYRNLKSFLPFVRGDELDAPLLEMDRFLFFGADPGPVLHSLLGTGITAQVLSFVYVGFLTFVPLSLAASLVWSTRIRAGLWYVTALCLAWLLGAASYYLIPSLGPAYAAPALFADLPVTGATQLQGALLENRLEVIYDPQTSGGVQSIAAFASLHVGVIFVATLICQLLRLPKPIRITMWVFLALTTISTVYFGWHYLIDLPGGFLIGFLAVYIGARMTGHDWRPLARRRVEPAEPVESAAASEPEPRGAAGAT